MSKINRAIHPCNKRRKVNYKTEGDIGFCTYPENYISREDTSLGETREHKKPRIVTAQENKESEHAQASQTGAPKHEFEFDTTSPSKRRRTDLFDDKVSPTVNLLPVSAKHSSETNGDKSLPSLVNLVTSTEVHSNTSQAMMPPNKHNTQSRQLEALPSQNLDYPANEISPTSDLTATVTSPNRASLLPLLVEPTDKHEFSFESDFGIDESIIVVATPPGGFVNLSPLPILPRLDNIISHTHEASCESDEDSFDFPTKIYDPEDASRFYDEPTSKKKELGIPSKNGSSESNPLKTSDDASHKRESRVQVQPFSHNPLSVTDELVKGHDSPTVDFQEVLLVNPAESLSASNTDVTALAQSHLKASVTKPISTVKQSCLPRPSKNYCKPTISSQKKAKSPLDLVSGNFLTRHK